MPILHDLYCGLGGWAEGFLAEGYVCIGYDIERHDYGSGGYPGLLVLQDILTLHGSECKDAAVIVASPPCQAYSYRAMPWKRAKALPPPDNTLFEACFRIQREASEAAGRYIPLIVENVRGAEKWVGPARWHFGSYYLWGDVPALMPLTMRGLKFNPDGTNHPSGSWFAISDSVNRGVKSPGMNWSNREVPAVGFNVRNAQRYREGQKVQEHMNIRDGHSHTRHLTNQREHGVKFSQSGHAWFDGKPRDKMLGDKGPAAFGSRSDSRKAASAQIAKIPFPLANHIARCFLPVERAMERAV
jgi:hypothetical protein